MKKIITIILMLASVAFIFGAYLPPPEDNSNFVIITGGLEMKTDDGLILRCLTTDDNSSAGDNGKHNGWTQGNHKGHIDDQNGKGEHKGIDKHQHGETSPECRFMLANYPNVNNLEIGDIIQIGAYDLGVINMYSVNGEVYYDTLELYSVTPQQ